VERELSYLKRKRVSHTAMRNALARASESKKPENERLFLDPFADKLLNFRYRCVLSLLILPVIGDGIFALREKKFPGMIGDFLCRTRYIDDLVRSALDEGFEQMVFLGSGLDSRPYRIAGMNRICVYELDHPETQKWKVNRLERILGKIPPRVVFAPTDFNRMELERILAEANFNGKHKTFIVLEGLTQYLKAESVDSIFRYLSKTVTSGFRVVFSYVHRGIIEGKPEFENTGNLMFHLKRLGEPWIFGMVPDEVASYLDKFGLELVEHLDASKIKKRYLKPLGRQMNVFAGEYVALAEKRSNGF